MIPLIIATYIYGAFLTAYLLGKYGENRYEISLDSAAVIASWPFTLFFLLLAITAISTRRRYWK
jgi:hypothetical protein